MPVISITKLTQANWSPPPEGFTIGGHVDIWRIPVASASSFEQMLNPTELEKKDRFRNSQNRDEFITSRGALRYLSSEYIGQPAKELVLSANTDGKPCWQTAGENKIYFNVAHSSNEVLIGFAGSELGIDVEKIKPAFDYAGILSRCFTKTEADWVLNSGDHLSAFYRLWTRKEAILKATGIGVHNDLHLVPAIDGEYEIAEAAIASNSNWRVSSFTIDHNVIAAIAHAPSVTSINFYTLTI